MFSVWGLRGCSPEAKLQVVFATLDQHHPTGKGGILATKTPNKLGLVAQAAKPMSRHKALGALN